MNDKGPKPLPYGTEAREAPKVERVDGKLKNGAGQRRRIWNIELVHGDEVSANL